MKRHSILVLFISLAVVLSASSAFGQIATTTAIIPTANPSAYGQYMKFTVAVKDAGGNPLPGGTAYLTIDGTSHMLMLQMDGTAYYPVLVLALGTHVIDATYVGDATYAPSAAPTLYQVVNPADTITTVTGSPNPASFGESVRVVVHVASAPPGGGTPQGTVALTLNGDPLGTFPLDSVGYVATSLSPPAGVNNIIATYAGTTGYTGSSGPLQVSVSQASSYTALSVTPDPSVYGQTVTLWTKVYPMWPASATPTGTMTFSGTGLSSTTVPLVGGMATITTNALPPGVDTYTATYSGSSDYGASASDPVAVTVNPADTTTAVRSSANPSLVGQAVTFTATVAPVPPGAGVPTGSVVFADGAVTLGTVPLVGGAASLDVSTLSSGSHAITASYLGDTTFAASAGSAVPQDVIAAAATVTLTAKPTKPTVADPITLTATVVGAPFVPTGTVDFFDGPTQLTKGVKLDGGGQATLVIGLAPPGKHSYEARYSGDGDYGAAMGSLQVYVDQAAVSIEVGSSANPAVTGQAVTLTATLTTSAGAPAPGGLVYFLDDGKLIGQGTVSNGVATFTTALACGSHPISVHYDGDACYKPADAALGGNPQRVDVGATTVVLTSSQNPSVPTQAVTFTASVSATAPAVGTPSGSVTFFDGSAPLATAAMSGGVAAWSGVLAPGSHDLQAVYGGDASFAGSTAALSGGPQLVQAGSTRVTVTSTPAVVSYGTSVTLTASVGASSGGGTPSGSVTFRDGSAVVATVPLVSGSAACVVPLPGAGSHTWFADYGGDASFGAATGSQTVVVGRAAAQVTVASSLNPAPSGQSFTLRAQVSFAGSAVGVAVPSGIVTFYDGSTMLATATLDASGAATMTMASTVSGDHVVQVTYAGDARYEAGGSSALTETIAPPPITVVVNAATVVMEGGAAAYTITVAATDGFDSEVVFTCTGLPAGLSYRFDPPSVPAGTNPVTTHLTVFAVATAATSSNAAVVVVLLGMVAGLALGRRPLVRATCACALTISLLVLCMSGCGGGGGTTAVPTASGGQAVSTGAGVASGTYPFTMTATSGSKSVSQALTVTVP